MLLLLFAFVVSLITVLARSLRMLLRGLGVLFTLDVVTLAMVFGGGSVRLRSILVMFSSLVVFFLRHDRVSLSRSQRSVKSPCGLSFPHGDPTRWK